MTDKQDMGVVTDADREAAIGILYCAVPNSFTADGQYKLDMELVAQAFRDHRLASQADQGEALNWFRIAKLAGEHGIRYRTNSALEKFLSAITQPVAEMECPVHGNPGQYIGMCCQEADKRNGKIGHKSGCVKINCAGCGDDFYSKDYRATHPQPSQKGEGDE